MTDTIKYKLANSDVSVEVEVGARPKRGDRVVSREGDLLDTEAVVATLSQALETVTLFGREVLKAIEKLSPDEASVEFGVALKGESSAIIAKTSAEGNLKISLTWKKTKDSSPLIQPKPQ